MLAQSPKFPALFDRVSGVRFVRGRAEVTEEQALALAERRYVDGILIDGTRAKDWAKARRRDTANDQAEVAVPEQATVSPDDGRRTRRSK